MNKQQETFIEEYIKDRNGAAAATRAGYAEPSARITASRLLAQPEIKEEVNKRFTEIYEANRMSIDEAINILADIARTQPTDLYNEDGTIKPIHTIPRHAQHAIEGIKFKTKFVYDELTEKTVPVVYPTEVKVTGKQTAIDKMLRHLGGYREDNDQKKADPIVLNINPLSAEAEDNAELG